MRRLRQAALYHMPDLRKPFIRAGKMRSLRRVLYDQVQSKKLRGTAILRKRKMHSVRKKDKAERQSSYAGDDAIGRS